MPTHRVTYTPAHAHTWYQSHPHTHARAVRLSHARGDTRGTTHSHERQAPPSTAKYHPYGSEKYTQEAVTALRKRQRHVRTTQADGTLRKIKTHNHRAGNRPPGHCPDSALAPPGDQGTTTLHRARAGAAAAAAVARTWAWYACWSSSSAAKSWPAASSHAGVKSNVYSLPPSLRYVNVHASTVQESESAGATRSDGGLPPATTTATTTTASSSRASRPPPQLQQGTSGQ